MATKSKTENNNGKKKARPLGWPYYATTGLVVASAAALLTLRHCEPKTEGIVQGEKECPAAEECPSKPVKNDKKCETNKAEHDSISENWDPASCGYCGDGIQQKWETKDNCIVDFVCDMDPKEREKSYGAFVEKEIKGETIWAVDIVSSAEFCPKVEEKKKEAKAKTPAQGSAPAAVATPAEKPKEEPKVSTAKRSACLPHVTSSASTLKNNIASRLKGAVPAIRSALGASNVPIMVGVTVNVDPSGTASIGGAYAVCGGQKCPNNANPLSAAGISSSGLPPVTGGNEPCFFSFTVTLAPG